MRSIGIIGNCNIGGMGRAASALTGAEITLHNIEAISQKMARPEEVAGLLSEHDLVLGIDYPSHLAGGSDALKSLLGTRFRSMPAFVFPAFQPDMMYLNVRDSSGVLQIIPSPVGQNSSSLVVFGYLQGLSVDQTCRLFCEEAYRELGYLDAWEPSVKDFVARFGLQYERHVITWSRRGCFTYTINHPRNFVIFDLTRELLAQDAKSLEIDLGSVLPDDLQTGTVWPVYPEIAARYGIEGSLLFKPHWQDRLLDLQTFVCDSFARYEQHTRSTLHAWPVTTWSKDRADRLKAIAFCA